MGNENHRPTLEWSWGFDPLGSGEVEIAFGGKAVAKTSTLNNAALFCERLNNYDTLLAEKKILVELLGNFVDSGVEFDDPRQGYVTMQVDRRDIRLARTLTAPERGHGDLEG